MQSTPTTMYLPRRRRTRESARVAIGSSPEHAKDSRDPKERVLAPDRRQRRDDERLLSVVVADLRGTHRQESSRRVYASRKNIARTWKLLVTSNVTVVPASIVDSIRP
jgi:hypothetical protein